MLAGQNKFVVLGIALIAAVALWFGMSGSSGSDATTIVTTSADGTATQVGGVQTAGAVDENTQHILEILLTLRAVSLEGSIFSNSAFASLKDFSTTIVPEPVGRPDPFAPFGDGTEASQGTNAPAAQSSTSTVRAAGPSAPTR